jgi:hypothetical protein
MKTRKGRANGKAPDDRGRRFEAADGHTPPGTPPSACGGGRGADDGGGPFQTDLNGAAAGGPPGGGRDASGKFIRGNQAAVGKGNPHNRRAAALRLALSQDVGEDEMRRLGRSLYQQGLGGDVLAARLFLEYVVGRPRVAVDPDELDLREWERLRRGPSLAALWFTIHEVADAGRAAELFGRLSAATADDLLEQLRAQVTHAAERFARSQIAERKAKVGK